MKDELINNLAGIMDYIKQGTDFVATQAPLYVQEFLKYEYALHLFGAIICFIGILASLFIGYKVYQFVLKDYENFPAYLLPFVLLCLSFGFFCKNVIVLLKIYFAPRVYLIENLLAIFNR